MDEAAEAYGRLQALLANVPKLDVPSYLVDEYHGILDELQKHTGKSYDFYRIPPGKVRPRVTSSNYLTHKTTYSEESYCDRLLFVTKAAGVPKPKPIVEVVSKSDELEDVERICQRFSRFVNELRDRPRQREPWIIEDEYDVQYAMHAILRLFFDDVRPEEWTPSYAGAPAKMDFLIPEPKIVIETKMSREGMTAKTLGDELVVDIARYAQHKDCKTLVCFVYDPEERIKNPAGVKKDLEKLPAKIKVRVFIER